MNHEIVHENIFIYAIKASKQIAIYLKCLNCNICLCICYLRSRLDKRDFINSLSEELLKDFNEGEVVVVTNLAWNYFEEHKCPKCNEK